MSLSIEDKTEWYEAARGEFVRGGLGLPGYMAAKEAMYSAIFAEYIAVAKIDPQSPWAGEINQLATAPPPGRPYDLAMAGKMARLFASALLSDLRITSGQATAQDELAIRQAIANKGDGECRFEDLRGVDLASAWRLRLDHCLIEGARIDGREWMMSMGYDEWPNSCIGSFALCNGIPGFPHARYISRPEGRTFKVKGDGSLLPLPEGHGVALPPLIGVTKVGDRVYGPAPTLARDAISRMASSTPQRPPAAGGGS